MGRRIVLAATLGLALSACSSRTLVLVDPCQDGGTGPCWGAIDASIPGDTTAVPPLRQGLVGLWHLDEGPGSMTVMDSSNNKNNGTLVAPLDPSTAWVTGHVGTGALQTGGIGFASVPNSASFDGITGQVTLSAWILLESAITQDYVTAASKQLGNNLLQYYHISLNHESKPSLFIHTRVPVEIDQQVLATVPVPQGIWTHLAGTYDGSNARLYVNGVFVDSRPISGTFTVDMNPLILGGNGNGQTVSERFPGRIDEIVLYNRALSAGEISQLASGTIF